MLNFLSVDGVEMPPPSSYSVNSYDIDGANTGRSETGLLHRNRVRAALYKVEAVWNVTESELKRIAAAIAPDSFMLTFYDATTAARVSKSFYAGDRNAVYIGYEDGHSWWRLSVNFVEY